MNTKTNQTGIAMFFIIAFLLIMGFISFNFLANTILPTIGIFNLILIPVAWEFLKMGCSTLWGLIQVLFNLDKLIEKDK